MLTGRTVKYGTGVFDALAFSMGAMMVKCQTVIKLWISRIHLCTQTSNGLAHNVGAAWVWTHNVSALGCVRNCSELPSSSAKHG